MSNDDKPHVRAVIFDWAGTTVDYGSCAPAEVFREIFRRRGVDVTVAEAREPMGRAKRDHIAAVLAMPRVSEAWRQANGRLPVEADVDRLYAEFLPLQQVVLQRHSDVIPGVVEVVAECRRRGMAIGSTTGYTAELMKVVVPAAAAAGFVPDAVITSDDVPAGRPAPWMLFRAMEQLGAYPVSGIVAVDDTPIGIEAGRNAGMWTVAIAKTGNALGLSQAEVAKLDQPTIDARLTTIRNDFKKIGAHYVCDGVADLPPVLDDIALRLERGEQP